AHPNGPIGVFNLDVNPPRPKGQPKISVEFRCDENGRITALARDRDTGKESRSLIALTGARSDSEVENEAMLLSSAVIS
ncbi:MAG TPA: Hsp70 family protein, partial [Abditibacteriaceae bacterium]|nr:Hsp70 family protein [Abditibacteriaceae bacterium]